MKPFDFGVILIIQVPTHNFFIITYNSDIIVSILYVQLDKKTCILL